MRTKTTPNPDYSFRKGLNNVAKKEVRQVRNEIMEALDLKTRASLWARETGKIEPKITEFVKITQIFNAHGIYEIWGE